MLRLSCVACGLTVPYKTSGGDVCPRCLVRDDRAVALIPTSDRPSSHAIGRLRILRRLEGERHVMILSGELDIASAQILEDAVSEACSARANELVLDMAGIEFMDSTGLRALIRCKAICEEHQCDYSLTPAQRPVESTLEATGIPRSRLRFRRSSSRPPSSPLPPARS
jgi:anti-sigma B factor antagonist